MIKKLPIANSEFAYSPLFTSMMSILCADFTKNKRVIMENFINLTYDPTFSKKAAFMEPITCHELDTVCFSLIPKNTMDLFNDFIPFVKSCIDRGQYVIINTDVYYIKEYTVSYQKEHYLHPTLIYGYNEEDATFFCSDYFDYNFYTQSSCDAMQVAESYAKNKMNDYLRGIWVIDNNARSAPNIDEVYGVNINKIYRGLEALMSPNSNKKITSQGYGFSFFRAYIEHLKQVTAENFIDAHPRELAFFLTHVKLMKLRISHFNSIKSDTLLQNALVELEEIIPLLEVVISKNTKSLICFENNIGNYFKIYTEMIDILDSVEEKYKKNILSFMQYLDKI